MKTKTIVSTSFFVAYPLAALIALAPWSIHSAWAQVDTATAEAMVHATSLSKAFRHAAQKATPSVVVVRSESKPMKTAKRAPPRGERDKPQGEPRAGAGENPFKGTPFENFFRDGVPEGFEFHGQNGPQMPSRSGIGSGVIVDKSGVVLTNNHVVEGADTVTVELPDGRIFTATEIKTDPESDLAVVRLLNAEDLPTATLGDSDKLEIGDWVIAIGTPFELDTTVSAGIISAKGRELESARRAKFLQTDAAINPGNSGGPLVNLNGEVIGITTAIASASGGYQGIGFAIPINLARWVSEQLIANGSVQRGFLGVAIGTLNKEMAIKLGTKDKKGALVTEVMPNTPAAAAGVQELDVITDFDGLPVDGPRSLQEVVERSAIGKPHSLAVLRDGKTVPLTVSVKALPDKKLISQSGQAPRPESGAKETFYSQAFGLEVSDKALGAEDSYQGFDGVLVDRVDVDGVAAGVGIGPGVLIRKVGKTAVSTVAEFAEAIEKESESESVLLQVRTPRGNAVILLKKAD